MLDAIVTDRVCEGSALPPPWHGPWASREAAFRLAAPRLTFPLLPLPL
jgi:hypothetical protein